MIIMTTTFTTSPILRHFHCSKCYNAKVHTNGLPFHLIELEHVDITNNMVFFRAACVYHDCELVTTLDKRGIENTVVKPKTYTVYKIPVNEWNALVEFIDDGITD